MSPMKIQNPDPPRSTLRQLGAELRSGLARAVRRRAAAEPEAAEPPRSRTHEPAPPDLRGGTDPDPVFAVAAEFRCVWDAANAAARDSDDGDVPEAHVRAIDVAYAALRTVRPTTAAGFRALAETWAYRLDGDLDGGTAEAHAAASLIAAAGVCVPPAASGPDPVFAAIERHLAARAACVGMDDGVDEERYEAAHDRRIEALNVVERTQPTTVAGLLALARHMSRYLDEDAGGQKPVEDTAAGVAFVGLMNACLGLTDARLGPAADAPVSPALVDLIARHRDLLRQADTSGLSDEAANALDEAGWSLFRQACAFPIAGSADFAAKLALAAPEITEGLEEGRTSTAEHAWRCIRADLLGLGSLEGLSAAAAVAESRVLAGGVQHDDGTVSYCDAGGTVWRQPVARWIAFVAMQLHSCARTEMGRLRVAHNGLPGEQLDALEAQARRDLRLDAVVALTRPAERKPEAEFERLADAAPSAEWTERLRRELHLDALAKAVRGESGFNVAPGSSHGPRGADPSLVALVAAWEAAERAGTAPGLSDAERTPDIDRASDLLRAIYAFPARTLADLCAKLPAYREEAAGQGDAPAVAGEGVELEAHALHGLVADLERLSGTGTSGTSLAGEVSNLDDPTGLIDAIADAWMGYAAAENGDDAAAFDRAYARRDVMLDAADRLPVADRMAVLAKALALSWISAVDLLGREPSRHTLDTNGRLALDIHAAIAAGVAGLGR